MRASLAMRLPSMVFTSCIVSGCAVVAVVDTAATVAAKTVGLAADAAVGTVKVAGKVVGKAADATLGSDKEPAK